MQDVAYTLHVHNTHMHRTIRAAARLLPHQTPRSQRPGEQKSIVVPDSTMGADAKRPKKYVNALWCPGTGSLVSMCVAKDMIGCW